MNASALLLVWSLTLGGAPRNISLMQDTSKFLYVQQGKQIFTNVGARLEYKGILYAGGESKIFAKPQSYDFSPSFGEFTFSAGAKYRGIEIGYTHRCMHPIKTAGEESTGFYQGSDEVFVKFTGKAQIF